MKTIIYTIYALTVLLFAGLARAESLMSVVNDGQNKFTSPVRITEVGFDTGRMLLHIDGTVPTPCHQVPSAVIVFDRKSPNTLVLRLISPRPTADACIAKLQGFETAVDLRQLSQASELPLDDKARYLIRTEGYDFALEVNGQDLLKN